MSILSIQKTALGNAVIKGQFTPTIATGFIYQQNQLDTFGCTVATGEEVSISMRIKPLNYRSQQKYGYAQGGGFQTFSVPFNTSATITLASLATLISASFPTLSVVAVGTNMTISTNNHYGLMVEYQFVRFLNRTKVTRAIDLTTFYGNAILYATPVGGDIRYLETGAAPTANDGLYVVDSNPFDIVGITNIMNARVITALNSPVVSYEICI